MNVALAIGTTVFFGGFYCWTSRINGMFFFGRSAGPERKDSAEGRAITRQYLWSVIATTAAAILLEWFLGRHDRRLTAIGLLLEAIAIWIVFARANRQVRDLEQSCGESPLHESVVQVPLLETPAYRVPSLLLTLLPMLLGAAAFAAGLLLTGHGTDMPAAWSAWNASVEAGHMDTLFGLSLGLMSAATLMLLVFRTSVRLRTRMAQYSVRSAMVMEWIGLLILLAVLVCNGLGRSLDRQDNRAFMIAALAAAVGTILWNQARAKRFVPPPVELGADDRWRWGLFYVDRNDPALFVQSRCGAGYTLNYGRMIAWPISLAMVAYVLTMLFLLPLRH